MRFKVILSLFAIGMFASCTNVYYNLRSQGGSAATMGYANNPYLIMSKELMCSAQGPQLTCKNMEDSYSE